MVQVSLFFIPQPLCALIIVLNIASVALGVIGFMTLWDVNLDATSMITIAMSVGFSVDFAAHITYGYMTECKAKYEKIKYVCNFLKPSEPLEHISAETLQVQTRYRGSFRVEAEKWFSCVIAALR